MSLFDPNPQPAKRDDSHAVAIKVLRSLATSFEQQAAGSHTHEVWITFRRCAEQVTDLADELEERQRRSS